MSTTSDPDKTGAGGLSPEKREDIWALIIAGVVLLICMAAPDQIYHFFKKILYLF
jgi:hypothetical protein